jgi:hypothetical protein
MVLHHRCIPQQIDKSTGFIFVGCFCLGPSVLLTHVACIVFSARATIQDIKGVLVGRNAPACLGAVKGEKDLDEERQIKLIAHWGHVFGSVAPDRLKFDNLEGCARLAVEQKHLPTPTVSESASASATTLSGARQQSSTPAATVLLDWRNVFVMQRNAFLRDMFRSGAPSHFFLPILPAWESHLARTMDRPALQKWFKRDYIEKFAKGEYIEAG